MPSEAPSIASNALVPSPPPGDDALPLRAAAKAAHISESTLRRLVQDGAVDVVRGQGGSIRISQSTVVELRSGAIRRGPPSIAGREAERARGELAKDAFALFARGGQLIDIVQQLAVDPDVVERLWARWVALQDLQRKTNLLSCMFEHHHTVQCDGRPMAQVSLCDAHASRVRVLSEQDSLTLSMLRRGETPMAVPCGACGNAIETGTCAKCSDAAVSFKFADGWVLVMAGKRELTRLSRAQLLSYARTLEPQRGPPAAPEITSVAGPKVMQAEQLEALLEELKVKMEPT